ncbi:hypothetical protein EMIHUDRAFT_41100, partial [Emiliania huxleyi CCMP1516]|uniref:Myosin motor domain-containing protein n=2 Tax=Emiliania huxleyi TaxID=2903 RepID=A0A0D3IKE3_EMIH1
DDLVMLEQLDAPLIAHCLQKRYAADKIYTWVGADHSVLISINPFKHLPIYGQYFLERFAAPAPNRDVEPHTYALARRAFRGMMDARRDQAILISGESGAGKTEATKQCLHFLADAAGTKSGVEQRILQANPILEAFGNAKTVRNDNSSRFGRWMEVHFESSGRVEGQIAGAFVESYLLEKSRVVAQAAGERSFHIFYQLCSSPRAAGLGLRPASEHRSLGRAGCTAIRGVDDVADFEAVLSSLAAMGLGDDEVGWALRLCAASVHLCDLDFEPCDGGDGSRVAAGSATPLAAAAECLGVATSALSAALVERAVVVRGEAQRIRNTAGKADEASAALAKAAYAGLFRDLVRRINAACGGERGRLIGVLDIFGFEIFEANSFEQLCINFANERLQRTFCEHTFENEQASAAPRPHLPAQAVYADEGIAYDNVPYIDNAPVLALLAERPFGLLNLLDEEVRVPQGSDAKWLEKVSQRHADHPAFGAPKQQGKARRDFFCVRHYAGEVRYSADGLVEKNADRLSRGLYDLLSGSSCGLTRACFPPKDDAIAGRVRTVGEEWRSQLGGLMQKVGRMSPLFIRCVKPNQHKRPGLVESKATIDQLSCAGLFEAVRIRATGFPFRHSHAEFARRYRWIA